MERSDAVLVRGYEPRDRTAVRRICCDTADRGEPVERFFRDRELFADLLTRYYTDWEPEAVWVAEQDGQVVGYVTGCLDTARYRWRMARRIIPWTVLQGVCRGVLWSPEAWRFLKAAVQTWRVGRLGLANSLEAYPAHLHVNLRRGSRGHGVGRRLVERFIEQVAARGLPGLHAAVRDDNHSACHFFERLGFGILSRHRVVFPDGATLTEHETRVYGKTL